VIDSGFRHYGDVSVIDLTVPQADLPGKISVTEYEPHMSRKHSHTLWEGKDEKSSINRKRKQRKPVRARYDVRDRMFAPVRSCVRAYVVQSCRYKRQ
jgi:hypothetical protein